MEVFGKKTAETEDIRWKPRRISSVEQRVRTNLWRNTGSSRVMQPLNGSNKQWIFRIAHHFLLCDFSRLRRFSQPSPVFSQSFSHRSLLINVLSSHQEFLDLPRLLLWVIQFSFTNCSLMYYSTKITAVISLNLHPYYTGLYSHPFRESYIPHSIYSNPTTTLSLSNHRDNF